MNLEQLYDYRDDLVARANSAPVPFITAAHKRLIDDAERQITQWLETHDCDGEAI